MLKQKSIRQLTEIVCRILSESIYDSDWLSALEKAFDAEVSVDKTVKHRPLYGGGTLDQIGYKIMLRNPINDISALILEGLRFNGVFLHAGIITYDSSGKPMMHGTLYYSVTPKMQSAENIEIVIDAINKKLKR